MGSKQMTYIHLNEFTPECHAFHDSPKDEIFIKMFHAKL